jgi:hypothetical protein
MKNIFLLFSAVALFMSAIFYSSCKKTTHPLNPTPSNLRIHSYSKTTVSTVTGTVNSNYGFTYDASGRVSTILCSSNDNTLIATGWQNITSTFTYFSDTIVKTTTGVNTADTLEVDTFVTNPTGQIQYVYTPNSQLTLTYFGKLLALEIMTFKGDSGTSITTDAMKFTSNNSDFLVRSWDGTLTANWAQIGYNITLNPPDVPFVMPVTVTWTSYQTLTPSITTHSGVNGYSDQLMGYNGGGPVQVTIMDGTGTVNRDVCMFPMDLSLSQNYNVYPSLLNRVGDYLQLESFTTYGMNIYDNTHLINTIENPSDTTTCNYVIDGDSKITQTTVTTKYTHVNGMNNVLSQVYDIQYETAQ